MLALKRAALIVVIISLAMNVEGAEKSTPAQPTKATKNKQTTPVYKPPLRGAPKGRIGGGTRGTSERESFSLQVLAPDHVGNTINEQPCLYWFISKSTGYPLELTVTERRAIKPVLEKTLTVPDQGGIQFACLSEYEVKLSKGSMYKWFVTLVIDPETRSKDILAGGMLEVVDSTPILTEKLNSADQSRYSDIYAEEGLWYDAIDAVSKMIETSPDNVEYRKWLESLLEQVGLADVAIYENSRAK